MRHWNKVFEVGSAKTGTSSLGKAFAILGLKCKGWDKKLHLQCAEGDFRETLEVAEQFDAFRDAPWHNHRLYRILDKKFPHSKFILLERNMRDWIRSHENYFSAEGLAKGDSLIHNYQDKKHEIIEGRIKKYEEIKEYFKDRPNDLLVMNICAGEGWEKLCPFLGLPLPREKFPHLNRTRKREILHAKIARSLKSFKNYFLTHAPSGF